MVVTCDDRDVLPVPLPGAGHAPRSVGGTEGDARRAQGRTPHTQLTDCRERTEREDRQAQIEMDHAWYRLRNPRRLDESVEFRDPYLSENVRQLCKDSVSTWMDGENWKPPFCSKQRELQIPCLRLTRRCSTRKGFRRRCTGASVRGPGEPLDHAPGGLVPHRLVRKRVPEKLKPY